MRPSPKPTRCWMNTKISYREAIWNDWLLRILWSRTMATNPKGMRQNCQSPMILKILGLFHIVPSLGNFATSSWQESPIVEYPFCLSDARIHELGQGASEFWKWWRLLGVTSVRMRMPVQPMEQHRNTIPGLTHITGHFGEKKYFAMTCSKIAWRKPS